VSVNVVMGLDIVRLSFSTAVIKTLHLRKTFVCMFVCFCFFVFDLFVCLFLLDLQLPILLVPITIKVVSSNPVHGRVYSIQNYVIKFVSDLRQVGGFLRILRFPPPIKLTTTIFFCFYLYSTYTCVLVLNCNRFTYLII
jgi:hypothetical protein